MINTLEHVQMVPDKEVVNWKKIQQEATIAQKTRPVVAFTICIGAEQVKFSVDLIDQLSRIPSWKSTQTILRRITSQLEPQLSQPELVRWRAALPNSCLPGFGHLIPVDLGDFLDETWLSSTSCEAARILVDAFLYDRLGSDAHLTLPVRFQSLVDSARANGQLNPELRRLRHLVSLSSTKTLGGYLHVNGNHWIFWSVDLNSGAIRIADALAGSHYNTVLHHLRFFLDGHPNSPRLHKGDSLPTERQQAGNGSCGLNSLHAFLLSHLPPHSVLPWTNLESSSFRQHYLAKVVRAALAFQGLTSNGFLVSGTVCR